MAVSDLIAASIAALFFRSPARCAGRATRGRGACAPMLRLADVRAQRRAAPVGADRVHRRGPPPVGDRHGEHGPRDMIPSMVVQHAGEQRLPDRGPRSARRHRSRSDQPHHPSRRGRSAREGCRPRARSHRARLPAARAVFRGARRGAFSAQADGSPTSRSTASTSVRAAGHGLRGWCGEPGQFAPYLTGEPDDADLDPDRRWRRPASPPKTAALRDGRMLSARSEPVAGAISTPRRWSRRRRRGKVHTGMKETREALVWGPASFIGRTRAASRLETI